MDYSARWKVAAHGGKEKLPPSISFWSCLQLIPGLLKAGGMCDSFGQLAVAFFCNPRFSPRQLLIPVWLVWKVEGWDTGSVIRK